MKGKILYVYNLNVSFIHKDISILERTFDVDKYFTDTAGPVKLVTSLVKQLFTLPLRIRSAQIVVIFFAGFHSLIPVLLAKLMRRPSLIVLGGSDCYHFPSIDYGNYRKVLMGKATALSIRNATHLAPVHEALINSEYTYDDHDFDRQGYQVFVREMHTPATTIYLEYDPTLFQFRPDRPPARSFITVGFGMDGNTFKRKGVDLIVEAARALPDCQFTIVGSGNPALHQGYSQNVKFLEPVPYRELVQLYQKHQYYFQLSMAEGFPSAICEAMLCGCVPIGSNVGATPFIIGDSGFVLEKKDAVKLVELCQLALRADVETLAHKVRARIEDICAPGSRASRLTNLVQQLIDNSSV